MATERDLEQLDDYLSNRLSPEEKALFEQKINADPELSNELTVQQELVKGIQKARIAELKTILKNIPVSTIPNTGSSMLAKLAAGTAVVGIIAAGIWFFTKSDEKETVVPAETAVKIDAKDSAVEHPATQTEQKVEADKDADQIVSTEKKSNAAAQKEKKTADTELNSKQPISVYDPTAEEAEGAEREISQAESQPSQSTKAEPSLAVSVDKTSKEYSFHYQYKDGKLFLYGPFEANLYEIMEFFSGTKRTVFLHYKSGYYLLKEVDMKIRPLTAITDTTLINKLEESRKQN